MICRNIQSTQQDRMDHAYCVGLKRGWNKMPFQLALNKTFSLNLQPFTHRRLKQRQKTKINKIILSAPSLPPPLHRFSTQSSPVDTGRKVNVHKTFRGRPGRVLNVLCTFNLRSASTRSILPGNELGSSARVLS